MENFNMKKTLIFLVLLLSSNHAIADCSAPDLTFEQHDGNLFGFKVTKLWDESEADNINKNYDTLIKFGDYSFLISAKNTDKTPIKLNVELSNISKKLLNHFITSPHYLNPEKQVFTVAGIEAYDLSGDTKEDLILFNVSPGANVYSGAVGIIDGTWKTLIKPTCY
jgi:hypothetical protein